MRAFSCLTIASYLGLSALGSAATTSVNTFHSSDFTFTTPITNALGVPLSNGPTADNGDGAVIQVGVFLGVGAKDLNAFTDDDWNSFTALTGDGSLNPFHDTTMGDGTFAPTGAGLDGFYTFGVTLDDFEGNPNPPRTPDRIVGGGDRIGIRYFDGETVATSTGWNTVSVNTNDWVLRTAASPAPAPANATMDGHAESEFFWESGAGGAFKTVVPEPSSTLLSLLGAILLLRRRRAS